MSSPSSSHARHARQTFSRPSAESLESRRLLSAGPRGGAAIEQVVFRDDPAIASLSTRVDVTVGGTGGFLTIEIDLNGDGNWDDAGERLYAQFFGPGTLEQGFTVPADLAEGTHFGRFTLQRGEVIDSQTHPFNVLNDADFGDAPASYGTLLGQNAARHQIVPESPRLGAVVDDDADGHPDAAATGDDVAGPFDGPAYGGSGDDEDGVVFVTPLIAGALAEIDVTASHRAGTLNAWIDFNRDGDWLDDGEHIFNGSNSGALSLGVNRKVFSVPADAVEGPTYARFRIFTIFVPLTPGGYANSGEVEDYRVNLFNDVDFGDAPATYPTLLAQNGARHQLVPDGPRLGASVDDEVDGQPHPAAQGDDLALPAADDEDGVVFVTPLIPGQLADVDVTASNRAGTLNAWIDYNRDGDWNDSGEHVLSGANTGANLGVNRYRFSVPAGALPGPTFARFRIFTVFVPLSPGGYVNAGEVEDYGVQIGPLTPPTVTAVYLDSTAWAASFRSHLEAAGLGSAALGLLAGIGAEQLNELPFTNLDRVRVRFSEDVSVQQADLSIRGVNVPSYAVGAFAYDAATFTATWTLADGPDAGTAGDPFANDKVLLDLDGTTAGAVIDAENNRLDGEWAQGTDGFPSGDGTPGGNFRFRFNTLPGDVNRNGGIVNSLDVQQARIRQFLSPGSPGTPPTTYTAFHDVDGNAFINAIDVQLVRLRQFSGLPEGDPALVAPAVNLFRAAEDPEERAGFE